MTLTYNPTNTVAYNDFWGPVFLAERDITGQVPINKVEYAGANVQAVCSPNNVFDSEQYQTCLSNLLATQFRWLSLDIYWDSTNAKFGLCPVQLPSQGADATTVALTAAATATATATSDDYDDDGDLYELGRYKCSDDLTVDAVLNLLHSYVTETSTNILAHLVFIELNLHAATLSSEPDGPAPTPSQDEMPTSSQLVGKLIKDNDLHSYVYTISQLLSDRSNLNKTWYSTHDSHRMKVTGYFNTTTSTASGSSHHTYLSTEDGWPSETYLLFSKGSRLLLTWGTVDDQMAAYDFASDASTIFPAGYMRVRRDFEVESSSVDTLSSGCFYDDTSTSAARVNVSWSLGSVDSAEQQSALPGNLTSCGISPFLNTSLVADYNGDDDDDSTSAAFDTYLDFATSAVLGWASGEPKNSSSPGADLHGAAASQFRCAVLDASATYAGRWRVTSCQQAYVAACRIDSTPFRWRLTADAVTFADAADACEASSSTSSSTSEAAAFGQPRTGLENTYLYHYLLNQTNTTAVWINVNSLAREGCWITTGANGTCTYVEDSSAGGLASSSSNITERQILLPTIGALLILFLTALTLLVKCNSNYRHNKHSSRKAKTRTRTGPGGWEYEGVPS